MCYVLVPLKLSTSSCQQEVQVFSLSVFVRIHFTKPKTEFLLNKFDYFFRQCIDSFVVETDKNIQINYVICQLEQNVFYDDLVLFAFVIISLLTMNSNDN